MSKLNMGILMFYSARRMRNGQYVVSKFDENCEYVGHYTLTHDHFWICDCHSRKGLCKHADLVMLFEKEKHLGDGSFYSFEKKEFVLP